jgi:hypothetical protein
MDAATIALITTLIQLAIKYVPEMIEQGTLAINLLTKTESLTDEEKATILAASTSAHEALQKRCDEQLSAAEAAGITE